MKKICIFFLSTLALAWFPVSEIAIVSMVSMLFPWHFSGIIWHPGGIPWNAMEFHGIPWMLCYFHGISVEFYSIQVECHGRYIVSMAFQWNSMASRWNAMEFHGMPWTLYYFHGISVKFHGISVECHGIPWDTEDWYSDKISEWI